MKKGTFLLLFSVVLLGGGFAILASLGDGTQNAVLAPGTQEKIPVNLKVEDIEYEVSVAQGSSVYEAMVQARATSGLRFEGREFSEMGFFVEELNGLRQNPRAGKYWIYDVNGEEAMVGVSNYIIQSYDVITWKYEDEE